MRDTLHLRPLEKEDLEFIYKMRTNPNVMDYWCDEPYTTMDKLRKSYEAGHDSDSHRQFILYHSKEKVGYLGLFDIDARHRNAEFAIMIDPAQQGKGYATDATRLIVEYGFNQLNLRKLFLFVVNINEKAVHIYQKVGFQMEGELKKHFFVDGSYHDASIMSLFREDYVN
ncbi:spermidine acetyltransferase [Virgibacillus profundi]|uniref:Spermidine acetyltransferase n=1 Tax=Virgibacillus profundi TaxID=2024555 RepID=A0A2A2I812_9BACI|nr:GNAT family N-acetyltransferase [Virgibacillus profundi]PAV28141.1 spermidine acetyltransferase [Virgibacillus profundi]PXY52446.1 GNAT family N-acetyltransferase [Virgibacillus profundi]